MKWLRAYWYIIPFGVFVAALYLFRGRNPIPRLLREVSAIEAERRVREAQIGSDHDRAVAEVRAQYERQKEDLNEKQQKEAIRLRKNPAKLAKFLVRAGDVD